MKTLFKKLLKYVLKGTLFFVGFVAIYLLGAIASTLITTGKQPPTAVAKDQTVRVYVVSNGIHTDWVLPTQHAVKDWRIHLTNPKLKKHLNASYIGFGWGDKDFFLKSVNANFPGMTATLKATFLPSQSLMHLSFYPNINPSLPNVYPLDISIAQYQALVKYILKSCQLTPQQQLHWVATGYQSYDFFFEAKGTYHLFNTCNNWTNRGLKVMGIRTGIWTPFEQGVLYHLKK
jgi:uncharacterized protein (TIGR02117 family)